MTPHGDGGLDGGEGHARVHGEDVPLRRAERHRDRGEVDERLRRYAAQQVGCRLRIGQVDRRDLFARGTVETVHLVSRGDEHVDDRAPQASRSAGDCYSHGSPPP